MANDQESAFIKSILAAPDASEPRLVFADWLEEQGDSRAKAVRNEVDLKRAFRRFDKFQFTQEYRLLENSDGAIYARNLEQWKNRLPQIDGIHWFEFHGGLVNKIKVQDAEAFRQHANVIFQTQPVYQFITGSIESIDLIKWMVDIPEMEQLGKIFWPSRHCVSAIVNSKHFCNLKSLVLDADDIGDDEINQLAQANHLEGLEELTILTNDRLTSDGIRKLGDSRNFRHLTSLTIYRPKLGLEGARALAKARIFKELRELGLERSEISGDGLRSLAATEVLSKIQRANLFSCKLDDDSLDAFAKRCGGTLETLSTMIPCDSKTPFKGLVEQELPRFKCLALSRLQDNGLETLSNASWLQQLETFSVMGNTTDSVWKSFFKNQFNNLTLLSIPGVGTSSIQQIASNESLTQLEFLELGGVGLDNDCVKSIADSPVFRNLRGLRISGEIGDEAVEAIANSPNLPKLQMFEMFPPRARDQSNKVVTDAGIEHLANSTNLKCLTQLRIKDSQITDRGIEIMTRSPILRNLRMLSLNCNDKLTDKAVTVIVDNFFELAKLELDFASSISEAAQAILVDAKGLLNLYDVSMTRTNERERTTDYKLWKRFTYDRLDV